MGQPVVPYAVEKPQGRLRRSFHGRAPDPCSPFHQLYVLYKYSVPILKLGILALGD